jgi:YVTN family beta-propeller protein
MRSNNSIGSRAAPAWGFVALFAMLAMGLGLLAFPAAAAPFAYVTNDVADFGPGTVTVIDTATTPPSVVATVAVGNAPGAVAVAPDGKHVYVSNNFSDVSVIDTTTNTVVATIAVPRTVGGVAVTPDGKHVYVPNGDEVSSSVSVIDTATNMVVVTFALPVGSFATAVAITPDGTHAYVVNFIQGGFPGTVSVIATATNTVVATIPVGGSPQAIAVAPDGIHAYVTSGAGVSMIATATNTVVATVTVGATPGGIAVTPDGKHAYVANFNLPGFVSVIDTASNTVVATVPVGPVPEEVAVTPDGKHAYVTNTFSNNVSVIDTASNTVVATVAVTVGAHPIGVAIIPPPPPGVPFLAFSAKLAITFGGAPNEDSFNLHSPFTLSSTAPALHPHRDSVTLQVGTFSITIPPSGSSRTGLSPSRG